MKQFLILTLAAVLGGGISIGTYKMMGLDQQQVMVQEVKTTPATLTNGNSGDLLVPSTPSNRSFAALPSDFTLAAKKATPAVVHIKNTQEVQAVANPFGGGDPFGGFFEDFFFGGPSFRDRGGQPRKNESTGSGVIISTDGYIITNNHVIDKAEKVEVTLNDQRSYEARVIGTDPSTDIALIKIEGSDFPTLSVADSDAVEVGEWVLAVGNPFNLASTVTAGIVSAKGRNINIFDDRSAVESFIQTDAAVNPGNSGGALINTNGDLIGINTAIATPTGTYAGYSFAVPTSIVNKVVSDLKTYGMVQRAYIGVMIQNLDGNLAKELGLDITQGVYVDSLVIGGSAEEAGMLSGDVITSVDGYPVNTVAQLKERLSKRSPGDFAMIGVNRNGRSKDLSVMMRNRSGNTEIVTKASLISKTFEKLGAELEEVPSEDLAKLRIRSGVRVSKLLNGQLKQRTDVKEGFIITKINEKPVASVEQVSEILQSYSGRGIMIEGKYPGSNSTYYYAIGL